jgi:type II secretory pathway predicted ATPase ExeA
LPPAAGPAEAAAPRDAFSAVADPARYVPREATEQALERTSAALSDAERGLAALVGPTGIGKSLVARLLQERLGAAHDVVLLPTGSLSADDLCEVALAALHEEAQGEPGEALLRCAAARARDERSVVLIVDHADAMPGPTAQRLAEIWAAARGALRLLLVITERDGAEQRLEPFAPRLERIALRAPLSAVETERYVQARLAAAAAPQALREALGPVQIQELHRRARGNPLRLHAEINEIQLRLWRALHAEPARSLREPAAARAAAPQPDVASPSGASASSASASSASATDPAALARGWSSERTATPASRVLGPDPRRTLLVFGAGVLVGAALTLAGVHLARERPAVDDGVLPVLPPAAAWQLDRA